MNFLTLDDSRVLHQLRILEILLTEESDTDITQPYVGLWLCLHSYESTQHPAISLRWWTPRAGAIAADCRPLSRAPLHQ